MKRISIPLQGCPIALRVVRRSNLSRLGVRQLVVLRGVSRDATRVAVRTFATLDAWGVVKDATVVVVPAPCIASPDGSTAFGVTARHRSLRGVAIMVGGQSPGAPLTRRDFLRDMLPTTIAHEWAHAEQWQSRGMWQERGINVRARTLLRGKGAT